jgi:hypothetical protein
LIIFKTGTSPAPGRANPLDPAPTKDRLIDKIIGGNPVFRGTRVMLAELVPSRAHALPEGKHLA